MTTTTLAPDYHARYTIDRLPLPSAAEVAELRRRARQQSGDRAARGRLAAWNLDGFTPQDVEDMRTARLAPQ
jgi:hypothetical protein